METRPKAVLITGGAKRLGFELVKTSLEMGFSVVVHYRNSNADVTRWLKAHSCYKNRIFFIKTDLTRNPAKLIDRVLQLPITLVGLVNNASQFVSGDMINYKNFQSLLAINMLVPLALSAQFFLNVKHGWIINMTDAQTEPGNPTWQNYRITKRFLGEMTGELAGAYAPRIRVNAIAPGLILPQDGKEAEFDRMTAGMPLKRGGLLDDLVAAYSFLIRSESITGQTIYIDGGWHVKPLVRPVRRAG